MRSSLRGIGDRKSGSERVGRGKPWIYIENVSQPTMTVYSPAEKNTSAAVIVFPGGGYEILAIDLEGTEVCDWLVSRGITCVLLKYRVPAPRSAPYFGAYPQSPMALEDAQRTIGLVRLHAAEWQIDPHKIGVPASSAATCSQWRVSISIIACIPKLMPRIDRVAVRILLSPSTPAIFP